MNRSDGGKIVRQLRRLIKWDGHSPYTVRTKGSEEDSRGVAEWTESTVEAHSQPMGADRVRLPEGLREKVWRTFWTADEVSLGQRIRYKTHWYDITGDGFEEWPEYTRFNAVKVT